MSILKEFREFAVKGNMIDMAVGIIIGGAFGTIVQSLVKDVIMPPIGYLLNGVDFSNLALSLGKGLSGKEVVIKYGSFISNLISFLIVAWAVFMLVKGINALKKRFEKEQAAAAPPEPSSTDKLLMEIRDSLKAKK
ncbi:MAG: large-conductance mechanosensitive channel protein MscL [Hyphomicrobiaceae bacterium]